MGGKCQFTFTTVGVLFVFQHNIQHNVETRHGWQETNTKHTHNHANVSVTFLQANVAIKACVARYSRHSSLIYASTLS